MPAIPLIGLVAGGAAGAAGIAGLGSIAAGASLGLAAGSAVSSLTSSNKAGKAAENFANTPAPQTNIEDLQAQTQRIAAENAERSAALEREFNPGAQELRGESLEALRGNIPESERSIAMADRIQESAGIPLSTTGFDSPLLRDAIARTREDLELGGDIPLDVRNMVTRGALARSGTTTGGLNLGRDLQARDLGLTSLDLRNQRLQDALRFGTAEASLERENANLRLGAERYGRDDLFRSAGFLSNIDSGNFARSLSASQLGQSIQAPESGLDPGAAANIAVANTNAQAAKAQQAAAMRIQAANAKSKAFGQLAGLGIQAAGAFGQYNSSTKDTFMPPVPQFSNSIPDFTPNFSLFGG